MSKTIHFEDVKNTVITATTYTLVHTAVDGAAINVPLNGEEVVMTGCPGCGRTHALSLPEFCLIASKDFEFYGTSVYCPDCSAEVRTNKEGGKA